MRWIVAAVTLAACSGGDEDVETFAPALEFLSPADGGTVPAGDVQVSIVVTDFDLVAPETTARLAPVLPLALLEATALAHDEEGKPSGYVELTLDGAVAGTMDATQFTLVGVTAGPHDLVGELLFADGDPLEDPVIVPIAFTAE
jgi:hypothetical protein